MTTYMLAFVLETFQGGCIGGINTKMIHWYYSDVCIRLTYQVNHYSMFAVSRGLYDIRFKNLDWQRITDDCVAFVYKFICAWRVNNLETVDSPGCSLERRRGAGYTPVCSLLAHHTSFFNRRAEFYDDCN